MESNKLLYFVNIAFPGDLNISQSATDAYSKCPFSFQCKYSLKLREKASDSIQKNDIGTLVHAVLDDFLNGKLDDFIKDGEIDAVAVTDRINEITSARSRLLLEFTPEDKKARVEHLLRRVCDITALSAINLAQEALQSGFKSTFFEFAISANGSMSPIKLLLEDNSYLVLGGIADRVDTMLKGDKLYVRVADYKTGSRTFSLESVRAGLSLQLLIYLFSIWENADEKFKRAAGASAQCEVIPAGAEYIMTMPGSVPGTNDSEALAEALSKAFKRSGIYLADSEIINEMDKGFSGRFVPVNAKMKDSKQAVIRSLEELNELKDELSSILTEIGNGIKSGNAAIRPLKDKSLDTDACEYCHLKPVCKNAGNRYDTSYEE
ncbi:MAG: PD-(D/E)XK nuclease family protein [Clostridia bacterium]|nr:PD-(D/E)XK nuclease family protein [Clostridia bacterium]